MIAFQGEVYSVAPQFQQRLEQQLAEQPPARDQVPTAKQMGLFDEDRPTMIRTLPMTGVAVVRVAGLIERDSYWRASWQTLAADLRLLDARQGVSAILIDIDSTGGVEMGCRELCDVIDGLQKPVVAYVSGYAMSAAYRFACHCNQIFATPSANVGSIGTMINLIDYSRQYMEEGLEVVSASTGPFKTMGVSGLPITAEQRAFLQERCDRMQAGFARSLSQRGITGQQLAEVSDGRYWDAEQALQLRLIDGIKTMEQVVADMVSAAAAPTRSGPAGSATQENEMAKNSQTEAAPADGQQSVVVADGQQSAAATTQAAASPVVTQQAATGQQSAASQQTATERPATIAEIRQACEGADSDFVLAQAEQALPLPRVLQNFVAHQAALLRSMQADNSVAAVVQTQPAGSNALSGAPANGVQVADVIERFEKIVADHVSAGVPRQSALRAAIGGDPELHRSYLQALQSMTPEQSALRRAKNAGARLMQ